MVRPLSHTRNIIKNSVAAAFALAAVGVPMVPLLMTARPASDAASALIPLSGPGADLTALGENVLALDDLYNLLPDGQMGTVDWARYVTRVRIYHTAEGRAAASNAQIGDIAVSPLDFGLLFQGLVMRSAYQQARTQPVLQLGSETCAAIGEQGPHAVLPMLAAFQTIRSDGRLTPAESAEQRSCVMAFQGSADLAALMDERLHNVANEPDILAALDANFAAWKPRSDWHTQSEAIAQYHLRRDAAQLIADSIRAAFDLESVAVYLVPLPDEVQLLGQYVPDLNGRPAIILNYNYRLSPLDDPAEMLLTITEEALHSVDYTLADRFRRGGLSVDDPLYAHAGMIYANHFQGSYIQPHDWDGYVGQYVERHAKTYRERFRARLVDRLSGDAPWMLAVRERGRDGDQPPVASLPIGRGRAADTRGADPT